MEEKAVGKRKETATAIRPWGVAPRGDGDITLWYALISSPVSRRRLVNNAIGRWRGKNTTAHAKCVLTSTIGDDHDNLCSCCWPLHRPLPLTVRDRRTGGGKCRRDTDMDLSKVCRLCLAVADWPVSVFDELAVKIAQCLQVHISSTDHLPKNVCQKCKNTVNEFHAYYTNTVECQKQLGQLVEVQQNMVRTSSVSLIDGGFGRRLKVPMGQPINGSGVYPTNGCIDRHEYQFGSSSVDLLYVLPIYLHTFSGRYGYISFGLYFIFCCLF